MQLLGNLGSDRLAEVHAKCLPSLTLSSILFKEKKKLKAVIPTFVPVEAVCLPVHGY